MSWQRDRAGFGVAPFSLSCLTEVLGIPPTTICSSPQGAGGCLCLGLEVAQGWDGLPGIAFSLGKSNIPHFPAASTLCSPAGLWGEAELGWGGAEGVEGLSRQKPNSTNFCSRKNPHLCLSSFVTSPPTNCPPLIGLGIISALNWLWWYFQCCVKHFWTPLLILNSGESP